MMLGQEIFHNTRMSNIDELLLTQMEFTVQKTHTTGLIHWL